MAVFSAFLSIIKIEQVKRTVNYEKNGSYRINFANKTVAQNIYNSLKEMEKIPVQRAEKI